MICSKKTVTLVRLSLAICKNISLLKSFSGCVNDFHSSSANVELLIAVTELAISEKPSRKICIKIIVIVL